MIIMKLDMMDAVSDTTAMKDVESVPIEAVAGTADSML